MWIKVFALYLEYETFNCKRYKLISFVINTSKRLNSELLLHDYAMFDEYTYVNKPLTKHCYNVVCNCLILLWSDYKNVSSRIFKCNNESKTCKTW